MIARKRIVLVVACAFLAVLSAQAAFDVYFLRYENGRFRLLDTGRAYYAKEGKRER